MKGLLKKMAIVAGCFAFSAAMMAQTKVLYLSSVEGTNVSQYDGQIRNVTMYRSMYKGWNTLSVPFSMTTEIGPLAILPHLCLADMYYENNMSNEADKLMNLKYCQQDVFEVVEAG